MGGQAKHPFGLHSRADGMRFAIQPAEPAGGDPSVARVLLENMLFAASTSPTVLDLRERITMLSVASVVDLREFMTDVALFDDDTLWVDLPNLIDSVAMTGSLSGYFVNAYASASASVSFTDTVSNAWRLLLVSDCVLAADCVGRPFVIGAIVDTLVASGLATSRLDAVAAVTAALAMESLITNGWSTALVDTAEFADALEAAARLIGQLVDAAVMMASAENSLRIVALVADTAGVAASLEATLRANADAVDGLLLYTTIRLDGTEYAGWVLNTTIGAPSKYTNFAFESLARFKKRNFGAGAGGIYELVGSDDDGVAIDSYVRTGLLDIGKGKLSRVPEAYLGFASNGDAVMKVVHTSSTGAKVEDWYRSNFKAAADIREGRLELGPGVESRYWQFVVHNTGGDPLELASIELRPVILSRRI